MPDTHLMIVDPRAASLIMTGQKRIEARLSTAPGAPYEGVEAGDSVFIKPKGQTTIAKAIVARVDRFDGLGSADINRLRTIYGDMVIGGDAFWEANHDARHATLITLSKVRMLHDESMVPGELLSPNGGDWRALSMHGNQQRQQAA